MSQTINSLLIEIATEGTIYDEILNTFLSTNIHHKHELISELAISFLSNQTSVNKAIKEGYFKYYFIAAVRNSVKSSTSPFHKNVRQTYSEGVDASWLSDDLNDDDSDLQLKILKEEQFDRMDKAMDEIGVSYFQATIFKMYYQDGMSYRAIEEETNVDHVTAHSTVKRIRKRIKAHIESGTNKRF